jgi:hypothetical protein
MTLKVIFDYHDGLFQDFIIVLQELFKGPKCVINKILIPITKFDESPFLYDEIDMWLEEIYENCPDQDIPEEYLELDDYYKNPDDPKMTKNTKKHEFCGLKNNTDDYSCSFDECPKRN